MNSKIPGLHHVTAIASDPQRNLDFYVGVLGLRFVKRTVNFDDRSFRINDENTLEVWDKDFAAQQISIFENDKTKCRKIEVGEYKARPWYVKGAENFASFFRAWL